MYGGKVPVTEQVAAPLFAPWQEIIVEEDIETLTPPEFETFTVPVFVQELLSVIKMLYEPAANPEIEEVEYPLLHEYVYAGTPPATEAETLPLEVEQVDGLAVTVKVIAGGCEIESVLVEVHDLASEILIV